MKLIAILSVALFLPFQSFAGAPTATTMSLSDYLKSTAAYDLDHIVIEKTDESDPGDQCGKIHYLEITVHGFWHGVQARLDFYVQTLTPEIQDRLYQSIQQNIATQGLPKCLLQDQFMIDDGSNPISMHYNYDPDFTTVLIPANWMTVPSGFPCAGTIDRPITTCWTVQNPYGV